MLLATASAAAHAIALSAVVILLGVACRRFGILASAKDLSALQATFLEPALAFSALSSLTRADFELGAPLLLWAPLHAALSFGIAYALLPSSPRKGALLLCASFGNAGALPNAIVPSMLPAASIGRGLLFVQCYMVPWRVLLWSVGPTLLRKWSTSPVKKDDDADDKGSSATPSTGQASSSTTTIRGLLLPPPTIGSLLGLAVACAPVRIRNALGKNGGPLAFVFAAAAQVGNASPPVALIGIGIALSAGGDVRPGKQGGRRQDEKAFTPWELAVCTATRLLLLPCVHIAIVMLSAGVSPPASRSASLGLDPLADPLTLVLLLQAGMPSAASMQALFQRSGADPAPLGRLLAWQYVLAAPAVVVQTVMASILLR